MNTDYLPTGYTENQRLTDARAWRMALQSLGYPPRLNSEDEADQLHKLVNTTSAPLNKTARYCTSITPSAEEMAKRYDYTPRPSDMRDIDFDNVEEVEF